MYIFKTGSYCVFLAGLKHSPVFVSWCYRAQPEKSFLLAVYQHCVSHCVPASTGCFVYIFETESLVARDAIVLLNPPCPECWESRVHHHTQLMWSCGMLISPSTLLSGPFGPLCQKWLFLWNWKQWYIFAHNCIFLIYSFFYQYVHLFWLVMTWSLFCLITVLVLLLASRFSLLGMSLSTLWL